LTGLIAALALSLVVPVLDVPLLGLSVSALLFSFVALDCLLEPRDWRPYRGWILLAILFAAGVLFSLSGNVLSGNLTALDSAQALLLVRFFYWVLVFVVAMVLSGEAEGGRTIALVFAVGVLILGMLRLSEAVLFGYWGGGNPRFLSQNDYGWGFSAFAPFATWLLMRAGGWRKAAVACGWLGLLLAVAGNGSRTSWITVSAGLLLLIFLQAAAQERTHGIVLTLAIIGGLLAMLGWAPAAVRRPIRERAATFASLAEDKPFLSRQLLLRKGLGLFLENPVFGVGLGRFTQTETAAALSPLANYRPTARFGQKTPHNAYIQVLAETGLAGALPLLALLLTLAWHGSRAAVAQAKAGETWTLPLLAGCACMSLHFWTLSGLTSTATWLLYGMLAGVAVRGQASTGRRRS
jgi:O-antigen ligase